MMIGSRQLQMTVTRSSGKPLSAPSSSTEQSVVAARGADGPTRSGCCGCEPAQTGPLHSSIPGVSRSDSREVEAEWVGRVCTSGELAALVVGSTVRLSEESRRQVRKLLLDLAVNLSHPVTGMVATLPLTRTFYQSQG